MNKHKHIIIDIVIGLLIIAVIILIDNLIVNLKSRSADEVFNSKGQEEEKGQEGKEGFYQLKDGERAFLPILNFHRIDKAPAGAGSITKSFFIEPDKFEDIINGIIRNDYEPVFVSEIVNFLENKEMPVKQIIAITFDDGNEDFYTNAWPILQKYKIKSSMYIVTGVGGENYLTKDQIVELDRSGLVEIGSHTVWHSKLTKVSNTELEYELKQSKEDLEKLLNKKIEVLCYPFGLYNDQVKQSAKEAGYKAGLTFDQDAWQDPDDLFALTRISVYPELNVMKFLDKLKNKK